MLSTVVAPISRRRIYSAMTPLFGVGMLIALALLIAVAPVSWLLLVLAACCGLLFALIFPWLAWLAFAFALPVSSGLHIGPASVTDLLIAASVGLWFATLVSQRRHLDRPRIPLWPLGLYLL